MKNKKRAIIQTENGWQTVARYKAEQVFGKPLAGKHPVHHANGDFTNDENNNLVICESRSYHMLLHKRMKKLKLKCLAKYNDNLITTKAVAKNNNIPYRLKVKQNKKEREQNKKYKQNKRELKKLNLCKKLYEVFGDDCIFNL